VLHLFPEEREEREEKGGGGGRGRRRLGLTRKGAPDTSWRQDEGRAFSACFR
jgi:hypothetical protein